MKLWFSLIPLQKMKQNIYVIKALQTFSKGYTVFSQAAHLSWVPLNKEESLLGVLFCYSVDKN